MNFTGSFQVNAARQRNTEFINRIQEESRGLMKGDL